MSILIKGMEMPKDCLHCPFSHMASDCLKIWIICKVKDVSVSDGDAVQEGRPDWCPLVEVPSHGRLIDFNAIPWENQTMTYDDEWAIKAFDLEQMPTVIEAEEDE